MKKQIADLKNKKMTKEELIKTLKEYSKYGTIDIPYDNDYGGKEVKETIFKTLGLDAKSIESIESNLFDFDYYCRDMQPAAAAECESEIKNILNKIDEVKDLEFGITDCVDNDLEEMLDAAEWYSDTLHNGLEEGLKNGDYENEEEWKDELEDYLTHAPWLR